MFSFRVRSILLTFIFVIGGSMSLPLAHGASPSDSVTMGSVVTIPMSEMSDFSGTKLLQFNPAEPSAKCLVPGALFAPGALLDVARLEADGPFEVNFPNARINFTKDGVPYEYFGSASLKMEGLNVEGTELFTFCKISYSGEAAWEQEYAITLESEGALPAVTAVTTVNATANTTLPSEGVDFVDTISVSATEIAPMPGDEEEIDEPEDGILGEPPTLDADSREPHRTTDDGYEPVGPGLEIDRTSPEPEAGDKIFVADGSNAGVNGKAPEATDSGITTQNVVAMSGSGCSLQSSGRNPQGIVGLVLAFLMFSLPLLRRHPKWVIKE